ncbi:MAG: glycosyltransferase family 1 protein [Patescibacteria group bacterium]|jgi:glycosyltransferase involved in cell wall biosynthesis
MIIGVDTRELGERKTGKGWYVYHVLKRMLERDHENTYLLYSNKEIDFPHFKNAKLVKVESGGIGWHFKVNSRLGKDGVDLYWAPTSPIVPAIAKIPTVHTIHDLSNLIFPQTHTWKGILVDKIFTYWAVKRTKKVITISEATQKDILSFYPFAKGKIEITPLGFDQAFKPMTDSEIAPILAEDKLKPGYILFVGTLEPRKNIETILGAFAKLDPKTQEAHPLIICGKKGWLYENIFAKVDQLNLKDKVKFLEHKGLRELPALYNGASVFVFPSLYEGFGLPPLEAMACGKAVIVSNVSSLPEVVGDAGILIEPKDADNLAQNITKILSDNNYRQDLEQRGLRRAKEFSWEKTADQTRDILSNILK